MPDNYQKAAEQWERYVYARDNGHTNFILKADQCDEYFSGEQWDKIVKQRLENQGKPVLTINKTLATLATVFGEQIVTKADISFRPARDGNLATAEALDKVYLQFANNNKLDRVEEAVVTGRVGTRRIRDSPCRWIDDRRAPLRGSSDDHGRDIDVAVSIEIVGQHIELTAFVFTNRE